MNRILIFFLFIFLLSGVSFAEVYKWMDENGVVHFTDDITQVPDKYRPQTEKMGLNEGTTGEKIEKEGVSKKKEEAYKDQLGRGEDYWKGRMEEWKKKLRQLQEKSEALRNQYNILTERYNDSKSSAERGVLRKERDQVKNEMDQIKIEIEKAENMIVKKIPEEAEIYKAKPEWIK